jgi:hypothetical protein
MNYADLVDLSNPQSFFNAFAFACCLISLLAGVQVRALFEKGRFPQSAFLLVVLFVFVGFMSHYSFHFLSQLAESF